MDRRKLLIGILLAIFVIFISYELIPPEEREPGEGIVVYGDTRTNLEVHENIVEGIMEYNPCTVVHTGDMVDWGIYRSLWEEFEEIIKPIRDSGIEYYPCVGNHEAWNSDGKSEFMRVFPDVPEKCYYSFTWNEINFVVVNQYENYGKSTDQYVWFEKEIDDEGPTAVVMHEPYFMASISHGGNENTRKYLIPLIDEYDVDVVFYGHSHMFGLRRENGTTYVVTGGGGAPLYCPVEKNLEASYEIHHFVYLEKDNDRIDATVVNKSGEEIYDFTVSLE